MKSVKVLITGCGAPGIAGTVYSLRKNYDQRNIKIIGTDVNKEAVGQHLCDGFYQIAPARDTRKYLNQITEICRKEQIDVFLPLNTLELPILADNLAIFQEIGTRVLVSSKKAIETANNKFELMQKCEGLGIPVGRFQKVSDFESLKQYAVSLGWPHKSVVVKPPVSNGSRGVRCITEVKDRKKSFFEEKPNSLFSSMDELYHILGDRFPELIITEYLPGDEYTIDALRVGDHTTVIPRKRSSIRSGITFAGETVNDTEQIEHTRRLSEALDLEHCFGFQFKQDENGQLKILECNPRIQGTMVLSTVAGANIIYSSVKAAMGEPLPGLDINWNTKLLRYWGAVGVTDKIEFI